VDRAAQRFVDLHEHEDGKSEADGDAELSGRECGGPEDLLGKGQVDDGELERESGGEHADEHRVARRPVRQIGSLNERLASARASCTRPSW
jgi:hypothetical protein